MLMSEAARRLMLFERRLYLLRVEGLLSLPYLPRDTDTSLALAASSGLANLIRRSLAESDDLLEDLENRLTADSGKTSITRPSSSAISSREVMSTASLRPSSAVRTSSA